MLGSSGQSTLKRSIRIQVVVTGESSLRNFETLDGSMDEFLNVKQKERKTFGESFLVQVTYRQAAPSDVLF